MLKRNLTWFVGLIVTAIVAFGISWFFYAPSKDLRGVWKTEGYGLVIDVSTTTIKVYETSNVHCTQSQTIPAHLGLVNFLAGVTISVENSQLVLNLDGPLNPVYADKIDTLPDLCDTDTPATPTMVFDIIWDTMNTHYAHFETHGVDWAARQSLRPDDEIEDAALLDVIKNMLTELDDGHTYIATPSGVWSPSQPSAWHDDRFVVRDTTLATVADLSEPSETGLRVGWAAPGIGYVYMTHMNPDTGLGQRGTVVAAQAMQQVLDYFASAKGIILDVRYNPGGSDDISMAYAGFFTDTALPAFTKTTRTETGYSATFTANIAPQATTTDVPVIVLTSPYTGSAAEIFTLAMRELPQVTTMGMSTSGGLSDILNFTLPNGWELGLSNQSYLTLQGDDFEAIGIPPDSPVEVNINAAQAGRDNVLAAAITELSK